MSGESLNINKRKKKLKHHVHMNDVAEESLSSGEAMANGIATIMCSCLIGYFLGWPVGILGYLASVPMILIGGKIAAYFCLTAFGIFFAAFVKFVWRLPVSLDMAMHIDEAYAILFPESSEAKGVARRRYSEVDHLVYTCSNLEDGIAQMKKLLGVTAAHGGSHPQFCTHNAILSLGNAAYLEIIAPDPNRKDGAIPKIFGLDDPTNLDKLVAFAVHPDPSIKGATFELIAQSMYLARYKIGDIELGKRQSTDGQLLQWKFTSPLCSSFTQPFVIDWGKTRSPAQTAPAGCKLIRVIFYCQEEEMADAQEMHQRIGLAENGRIQVVIKKSDGPKKCMVAEIMTPKGRKVFLGQSGTKIKDK